MSTLKERIEEIQTMKGWDDSATANVAGVSRSAVAQWRGQGSKIIHSIGNMQAAENLERETGFRALWIAKGEGPKQIGTGSRQNEEWPFPSVSQSKVSKLSDTDKSRLDAALVTSAAHLGLDIKKD